MHTRFFCLLIFLGSNSLYGMQQRDDPKRDMPVNLWVDAQGGARASVRIPLLLAKFSSRFLPQDQSNFYIPDITHQEVLDIMPLWQLLPGVLAEDPQAKEVYKKALFDVNKCFVKSLALLGIDSCLMQCCYEIERKGNIMCVKYAYLLIGFLAMPLMAMPLMAMESSQLHSEPCVRMWVKEIMGRNMPVKIPLAVAMQSDKFCLSDNKSDFYIEGVNYWDLIELIPIWKVLPKVVEGDREAINSYQCWLRFLYERGLSDGVYSNRIVSLAKRIGIQRIAHDIMFLHLESLRALEDKVRVLRAIMEEDSYK